MIIGADYLWTFQTGGIIRGETDEPVAIETELGWVLSGPLKIKDVECEGSAQFVDAGANLININSVTAEDMSEENEIQREICKLWDLDSLGIKKIDEVHEAFVDSITFDGERYSVRLPWKKGHGDLPSNYENSGTGTARGTWRTRHERAPRIF